MPRLSIAIVSNKGPHALETTLVSVLENRPADCEIVAALGHAYDDPYQLAGEVCFVDVDAATNGLCGENAAFAGCRGDVVHLLEAGTKVSEGWADAALAHFERDPHIGSVAPLVMNIDDGREVVSAGIDYRPSGKRKLRMATMALSRICDAHARPELVLGPSSAAGFYRRAALLAACDCLGCVAGHDMADADVALSLAAMGYLSVLEPRCVVHGQAAAKATTKAAATVAAGRGAEAVFWRHAAGSGWCLSLAAHAALVACEMCAAIARPVLAKRLLGRLLGTCGAIGHVGHAAPLMERHRPADEQASTGPRLTSVESTRRTPELKAWPAAARRAA